MTAETCERCASFLERYSADLRSIQRALHRIVEEGAPLSVADKIGTLEWQVYARLKELDKAREGRSEGRSEG
jgi:hypothetical protein